MIQKFNFKPQNSEKITLFANKAEAIVFWLSIAGLIFVAIFSLFRYLTNKELELDKSFRKEIIMRIEILENKNKLIISQIDSLKTELQNMNFE